MNRSVLEVRLSDAGRAGSWMSVQAYQSAGGPKEPHRIDGASHVGLYDKDE